MQRLFLTSILTFAGVLVAPARGAAQPEPPPGSMTFALTGDAIISRRLAPFTEPEYLSMIELIRNADVAFTNLEVLFHDYEEGYPAAHSGGTWMAAESFVAGELVWAGLDLVSRANNHTMDYGAGGLRATTRALDAVGLAHAGAGENLAQARAPAYVETDGGRVALISVASTFSDEDRAGPQRADIRGRPGLSPLRYTTTYVVSRASLEKLREVSREFGYRAGGEGDRLRFLGEQFVVGDPPGRRTALHGGDLSEILAAVRDARRQADWVIVTSHSHESAGPRDTPADFLVRFARAAIDAGADVFVGHGPHVMRGIEIYRGKPIFYSLANFIFQNETIEFLPGDAYDQYELPAGATPADYFDRRIERSRTGGFPGQQVYWESVIATPRFQDGGLAEVRLYPITLGFGDPRPQRGRPRRADREAGQRIIETLIELSQPFGTDVHYLADENVGLIRAADIRLAEERRTGVDEAMADRIEEIHRRFVFADTHAHPSRFHRANVPRIAEDEIARYRRGLMDVVVSNVSTDAVYGGGYVERDGTRVDRGEHSPRPGQPLAFTQDRIERIMKTIEDGDAVLAESPAAVLEARRQGRVALLPALEGADGLDGQVGNVGAFYEMGVRLIQLVHFRDNELGHIQTYPYSPGGLTSFGRQVVEECNRLGIIIDLAHANTQTITDVLEVSRHPVIFSHTGAMALRENDRHLRDDEIRAIAANGGVIGIWPNGSVLPDMEDMVRHIDYVKGLVGIDHVGIGSDLRGMSRYTEPFGAEANFRAIAAALLQSGYTDEEVGKIMGGNFFRVWQAVTENRTRG
jgi:microsomal dipeptidase-like Zn-dependent dipeptidase/poly-gamma-glutamate capsule biosynthesis protein CapA/YwtB (metallophosphatase superfamily)